MLLNQTDAAGSADVIYAYRSFEATRSNLHYKLGHA